MLLLPFRKVPVTAEKPASYSRCTCDPKFFPDRFSQVGSSCLRCGRWPSKESPCVVEVYLIAALHKARNRVAIEFFFVIFRAKWRHFFSAMCARSHPRALLH